MHGNPWRKWFGPLAANTRSRTGKRSDPLKKRQPSLQLEQLEDRFTPAAPTVLSILRTTPAVPVTNASAVVYTVNFSEDVTGVDASDFSAVTSGTVASSSILVAGSGASYAVTIDGVSGDGTLALHVSDDDTIVAVTGGLPLGDVGAGNGAADGPGYTIDRTAPTATITAQPALNTLSTSASFSFTGTDPTTGGVASGLSYFEYSLDGGTFAVAASPVALSGLSVASHTFEVRSVDQAGNVGASASYGWTVTTPPVVQSISRTSPSAQFTNAGSVAYTVNFDKPVTGVGATDFKVLADNALSFDPSIVVTGSSSTYLVTINGLRGAGALRLQLVDDDSILGPFPLGGPGLYNGGFLSQSYSVSPNPSTVAPYRVSLTLDTPNSNLTAGSGASYTIVFSEPVAGFDATDLQVFKTGTVDAAIPQITPTSSTSYSIVVPIAAGVGQFGLNFLDNGSIRDADGNRLANNNATFGGQTQLTVGSTPSGVAAADFNGDGRIDLAAPSGGTISILLNIGFGAFQPFTTMGLNQSSFKLTVADVNADGVLDVLAWDFGTPFVAVYLGNGNGTFRPGLTTGSVNPSDVAVADVNADGKADLLIAEASAAGRLRVKFGNGDGTFASELTYSLAGRAYEIGASDVNGDGFIDVAVTTDSNNIRLLLGNGDGTFRPPAALPIANFPRTISFADLNRDGAADIVSLAPSGSNVMILFGNGDGTFRPLVSQAVGSNPSAMAVSDLNADGTLDLVIANTDDASVLLGNGDGTFRTQILYSTTSTTKGVAVADFDGDGTQDLVVGIGGPARVAVRLQISSALAGTVYSVVPPVSQSNPHVVSIAPQLPAPTNGDTRTFTVFFNEPVVGVDASDFGVASSGTVQASSAVDVTGTGTTYSVTVNTVIGNGGLSVNLVDNGSIRDLNGNLLTIATPTVGAPTTYSTGSDSYSIAKADLNHDGFVDLIAGNLNGHSLGLLFGNGDGTFRPAVALANAGRRVKSVDIADYNNDGNADIVVSSWNNNALSLFLGNGDGTFRPIISVNGFYSVAIKAADINLDGFQDIIYLQGSSGSTVEILLGNGNGTFRPTISYPTGVFSSTVNVADINGDGVPDLLVGNTSYGRAGVLLGVGNGTFSPMMTFVTSTSAGSIAVGDFDFDGKLDMAIASDAPIAVHLGNGNGTFRPQSILGSGQSASGVAAIDINRDGILDIVASYAESVSIFPGNGDGSFRPRIAFPMAAYSRGLAIDDFNRDDRMDFAATSDSDGKVTIFLTNPTNFIGQTGLIDHTVPTVSIISTPLALSKFTIANFSFTGSDPVTAGVSSGVNRLEYQFDGGAFITATSPLSLTNLAEGSHTFRVRAIDNAGNVSAPAVYNWIIDSTAPTVSLSSVPQSVTFETATFAFDASDPVAGGISSGVNRIEYQFDNGTFAVGVSPIALSNLSNGNHSIGIRAIDNSGNVGATTTFTWLVDFGPASVQSIERLTPVYALTNATSVTYQVTFNKPVTGVDAGDFAVALAGVTATPLVVLTPVSGSVYNVAISGIAGAGTLALNLVDNGSIRDVLGNPLAPTNAPATFQAQQTFAAGVGPVAPTLADVNGDGKRDLLVANGTDSTVSVFLGNGDGTFQPQQTFATDASPASIAVGDLNADGKLDLVIGNTNGSNAIGVLYGNGDGSFQPSVTFAAGAGPVSVGVGDVSGDGKLDIVVANRLDHSLSVLLGNSDGTFAAQQTFAAGALPSAIVLADVSGDGKPDVIVASTGDGGISVLLGNGDGTFGPRATFATGANPTSLAVGDLDVDGRLDIAVANSGGNTVSVLLGNGNGTFKPQQTFASSAAVVGVAIGNLNGDRKPDLIVANGNGRVSVLLGNGDGTFQPQTTFAGGTAPLAVAVGDVNGDGRADLATTDAASVGISLNGVNGNFSGQSYTFNQISPLATLSNASITENNAANAVVGTLSPNDPGAGGTFAFSLPAGLTDNAAFNVSGTSLRASAAFDYEVRTSYVVTVRVTHISGLSYDKTFTINIQNVVEIGTVYVDDDWASLTNGTVVPDADPVTAGNQPATIGATAFGSLPPAVAIVDAGGTGSVVVLPGTYAADVTLGRPVLFNVTAAATISGVISGPNALVKQGAGVLTLTGANTYTGGTTVGAGTLQIGNAGTTGSIIGDVVNNSTLTFNRSDAIAFAGVISGTGGVVKTGNGNLTLSAANTFGGGLIVNRGNFLMGADNQLGAAIGVVEVNTPGRLIVTSSATSSRQFFLVNATIQVNTGVTLTLANAEVNGGFLSGPGTIATSAGPTFATTFSGVTTQTSMTINANGADAFNSFTNNGILNLSNQATTTLAGLNNESFGRLNVNGTTEVNEFSTTGQFTVNGSVVNVGASDLGFGGISTINAGGLIDLQSTDAFVANGLVKNNGTFGSSTNTILVDFGGYVKGTGTFGNVITQNGGFFAPGGSPGAASTNKYNINSGGALEFEVSNATGAAGNLSGWDLMVVRPTVFDSAAGILNLDATAENPYSILLKTRLDVGDRTSPGAAANFNPSLGYAWKFADASAALDIVSGSFDPAMFNVDVSGFANSYTGSFGVELRDGGKNLYLVYTPPAVPTGTSLVATPNATTGGELVTFTATVSPNPGSLGTVNFRDAGQPIAGGDNVPLVGGVATFQISTLTAGSHPVSASYSGAAGFAPSVSAAVNVAVIAAPPQLLSVTPNGNLPAFAGVQRSQVVSLQVVFNQPVQIDTGAFSLALYANNLNLGSLSTNLVSTTVDGGTTWVATFSDNTDPAANGFQSIKDGVYDLNVDATKVHPLGVPGVNALASAPFVFHRLFGDATGEELPVVGNAHVAIVAVDDNFSFRSAFANVANYRAHFDFDGDGVIGVADNFQFRSRFNRPLTWSV